MLELRLLRCRCWTRTTYCVGDHCGEDGSVGIVGVEPAYEDRNHGDLDEGDLKETRVVSR